MNESAPVLPEIVSLIQVRIPLNVLLSRPVNGFIQAGLNPEIGLNALDLILNSSDRIGEAAQQFRKAGRRITLHAPFADLAAGSSDPAIRTVTRHRFAQMLRLLPVLNPETVVCHTGYDWRHHGYFRLQWLEKSLETWIWLATQVRDLGSRLMLENVYEQNPEELRALLEPLSPCGVGFCLDTGHQAAFSNATMDQWLDALLPYLGQVHIHDNRGRKDEHLAPGCGHIDFKRLFDRLALLNRRPTVTLEINSESDLPASLEYLGGIWPWF
ncbi:MAG: sugar phosphate isomerase/epimerase [Desulfobacterales bacterium]|nr:sugar phosphate isomerase/epimerase [Desulfobacterales bacterium]MDD3081811.1 sugar phosphate isomerase/epimerase [Desulfobacterales bacterium]